MPAEKPIKLEYWHPKAFKPLPLIIGAGTTIEQLFEAPVEGSEETKVFLQIWTNGERITLKLNGSFEENYEKVFGDDS